MARLKTNRRNGSLVVKVLPSLDHPEQAAICMTDNEPIRIHGTNGGYLFSIVQQDGGPAMTFQDRRFYDQRDGRLALRILDTETPRKLANKERGCPDPE